MAKVDEIFKANCRQILEHGFSTENEKVRAVWEDGTPAHTIKTFGVVNRYNLQEEFPLMTCTSSPASRPLTCANIISNAEYCTTFQLFAVSVSCER